MLKETKPDAPKTTVGKVETGGTGSSSDGGGTDRIDLPHVGYLTPRGTVNGTRTVTPAGGNGAGTSDSPRKDGGTTPGSRNRPNVTAAPDKWLVGNGANPTEPVRGTSKTGVREGVGGDVGGAGGQGTDSRKRNQNVSAPENVDRVEKKKKPDAVPFMIQEGATKGKKADLKPEMIAYGVEGFFATLGGLTDHDWWEVTPLEADGVAQPLTRILNRMDPLQRQVFERYFDPAMLLLAVGMVVAPRLKAEMYLREEQQRQSLENARSRPTPNPVPTSEQRQANADARSDVVFRRNDVIEHFRQRPS